MALKNSLVQQDTTRKPAFSVFLTNDIVKRKINEVVGGKDGQRFMTQILSAVTTNPALQECEQMSILNCAFLGEGLKLSPSPQLGQYYMVPFKKWRRGADGNMEVASVKATFVLGWKGYIQLAIRSGYYKKINVLEIKEGELVNFDPLEESIEVTLIDDEEAREAATTIGYYAMFEYQNGFKKTIFWSKRKMMIHADKYSKAFTKEGYDRLMAGKVSASEKYKYSSFWYTDFDGMALKTMVRQLIGKWGIMSIDMQKAYDADNEYDSQTNPGGGFVDGDNFNEPQAPSVTEPQPAEEAPIIDVEREEVAQPQNVADSFFDEV